MGLCESIITSTLGNIAADSGGFMTVVCIVPGTLSGVTSRFPKAGITPDTAPVLAAEQAIYGIASFTIGSGTWQIFWHKS